MSLRVTLVAATVLASAFAAPSDRHEAQGALTINGKEIPLKFANAVGEVPELTMPDNGKDGYDLIVTDRQLTAAELDCRTLLQLHARKGNVNGIILAFNPVKKASHGGSLLFQDKQMFFSLMGDSGEHKFDAKSLTADSIAGRAWMPQEKDMSPTGTPLKMRYDVTVDATVRRPPPVTAALTGPAAAKSAQAGALLAFCRAARAGNVAGIKRVAVPEQMELIEGPEGKQFLAMMRQAMPDPARLKISKVVARGSLSVIHATAPAPLGDATMKCYMRDGKWRVSLN
jgi:hypothetical protein